MSLNVGVRMINGAKVPMTDGVQLSADLYLPDALGSFPTVLMRTPYDNNTAANIEKGRRLANNGYAVVIQDCRGRFDSEGIYYPFVDDGSDGYDTQEWIGRQPWSNGKIGMAGGSYVGWVQLSSAPHRSEFLTCLAPRVMAADLFTGLVYRGGVFQLNVMMTWGMRTSGRTAQSIEFENWREAFRTLPLEECDTASGRDLPFWKDWLAHPTYDEYWAALDVSAHWRDFAVPALNLGGWYDLYADNTFLNYNGISQHGQGPARQSKLIVGPWPHALSASPRTGDVDYGAPSQLDLESIELRWFDYWLKGIANGILEEPPLRLFIMGRNEWRDEREWPLARTDWQMWYFHSGGQANTLLGDGTLSTVSPADEPPDRFTYVPAFPVQTVGGNNCCSPHLVPWGPYDQRDVEMRGDVLCFTSTPLKRDLEVTGPIKVVLYAASDCVDTDWTGKLVDVRPSGYAQNLCDGIIRARYRESITAPSPIQPGQVYRYEIDLMVTGNVFLAGHRIRVEISSSNFPRYGRNLNTGLPIGSSREMRVAHQTVLHNAAYPSHIVLPVIPYW
jgi:putative CocE/NonD family hydrolase